MDSQQLDPPPPAATQPPPATEPPTPTPTPVANPTPKRGPTHNHPPYAEMITTAIGNLNERSGSSKRAIAKYIESNYTNLPASHAALLGTHLKRLKDGGEIVMVKHSYKLPRSGPVASVNGAAPSNPATPGSKRRPGRPRKNNNPEPLQAAVPVFAPPVDMNAAPVVGPEVAIEGGSVYVDLGPVNGPAAAPVAPPSRGRGRPPKQGGVGRPKKNVGGAAPAAVQVKGSGRPRGRPPKPINVATPVAVGGGVTPVAVKRRGRPPKSGGEAKKPRLQSVVKQKTPRKLSGKPLGRPKKNASAAAAQPENPQNTQLLVAYLDLKGKLENLQSRVKQAANVIKPCLNTEDAVNAFQELELLATVAPPNVQSPQPQPQS